MSLVKYSEFLSFLQTAIMDGEPEQDAVTAKEYSAQLSPEAIEKLNHQIQIVLDQDAIPLEEIGTESNRWFGSDDEAREWLQILKANLAPVPAMRVDGMGGVLAKDSNGVPLLEGDSVTVIKDLKVKGGSSDLKRGTLIKKIHLTSDEGLIECRVGGSTLVLKTEFLKKTV